jgi:hypothetical protein
VIAITMPASTTTKIATCIQIQERGMIQSYRSGHTYVS